MSYLPIDVPKDVKQCADTWSANCGPCALAAALRCNVADVRLWFVGFESRKYVNPTHMKDALLCGKQKFRNVLPHDLKRGLAFIQWGGFESLPIYVQYRHTHWIAVDGENVYEVNAGDDFEGAWVPRIEWNMVMPRMMKDVLPLSFNGKYTIRTAIEIL